MITATLIGGVTPQNVQVLVDETPAGLPWHVFGTTGDYTWTVPAGRGIGDGGQLVLVDNRAPGNVAVTYTFEVGEDVIAGRTNFALNPRGVGTGSMSEYGIRYGWARSAVTSTVISLMPGLTTCMRLTCPSAQTGAGRGFDIGGNADIAAPLSTGTWLSYPVTPGVPVTVMALVRSNRAFTGRLDLRPHNGAGAWTGSRIAGTPVSVPAAGGAEEGWRIVSCAFTPPAGTTHVVGSIGDSANTAWVAGDILDATAVLIVHESIPNPTSSDYFDGTSPGAVWDGPANQSTSTLLVSSITSDPITVPFDGDFVLQSLDGTQSMTVGLLKGSLSTQLESRQEHFTVAGRSRPVVRYDVTGDTQGSFIVLVEVARMPEFRELLRTGEPLLYRLGTQIMDHDPVGVISYGTLQSTPYVAAGLRAWSFDYALIDDPYMDVRLGGFSWNFLDDVFAGQTWDAFDAQMAGISWDEFDRFDWSTL